MKENHALHCKIEKIADAFLEVHFGRGCEECQTVLSQKLWQLLAIIAGGLGTHGIAVGSFFMKDYQKDMD